MEGESQDIIHLFQFIWPQPVSSSDRKRNLLSCFYTLLSFLPFCSLSFFYFGGRLAGLSMAHICSSSLLVFTTALGLPPPKLMDQEWRKDGAGGSQDQEILQAYFWLRAVSHSLVWAPKNKSNSFIMLTYSMRLGLFSLSLSPSCVSTLLCEHQLHYNFFPQFIVVQLSLSAHIAELDPTLPVSQTLLPNNSQIHLYLNRSKSLQPSSKSSRKPESRRLLEQQTSGPETYCNLLIYFEKTERKIKTLFRTCIFSYNDVFYLSGFGD